MKRNSIKRVAQVANNRESVAAKNMADKRKVHKRAEEKHDQIVGYRSQYEAHLDQLGESGMSCQTMSEYRRFLCNLDEAIDQQSSVLEKAAERLEESRAEWLHKYQRRTALEQVIELQDNAEKALSEKKQQKLTDEMSGNRSAAG